MQTYKNAPPLLAPRTVTIYEREQGHYFLEVREGEESRSTDLLTYHEVLGAVAAELLGIKGYSFMNTK